MKGWLEWVWNGLYRRRKGIRNVLIVVAIFSALVVFSNRSYFIRPERTIDDAAFVKAANKVCGTRIVDLAESREESKKGKDDEKANAAKIERVTAGLTDVIGDLRALTPNAASKAEVDEWLANWDTYIEVGRDYAAALRRGQPDEYEEIAARGDTSASAIRTFARANRIDNCTATS